VFEERFYCINGGLPNGKSGLYGSELTTTSKLATSKAKVTTKNRCCEVLPWIKKCAKWRVQNPRGPRTTSHPIPSIPGRGSACWRGRCPLGTAPSSRARRPHRPHRSATRPPRWACCPCCRTRPRALDGDGTKGDGDMWCEMWMGKNLGFGLEKWWGKKVGGTSLFKVYLRSGTAVLCEENN